MEIDLYVTLKPIKFLYKFRFAVILKDNALQSIQILIEQVLSNQEYGHFGKKLQVFHSTNVF